MKTVLLALGVFLITAGLVKLVVSLVMRKRDKDG